MSDIETFVADVQNGLINFDDSVAIIASLSQVVGKATRTHKTVPQPDITAIVDEVMAILCVTLAVDEEDVIPDSSLSDYGFNSISLTEFSKLLSQRYGQLALSPSFFLENPSITAVADFIARSIGASDKPKETLNDNVVHELLSDKIREHYKYQNQRKVESTLTLKEALPPLSESNRSRCDIAVIGIGGRFPQSNDIADFWQGLLDNRSFISKVPLQRWDWQAIYGEPDIPNKTDCCHGAFIDGIGQFDALHFNIAPNDAALMDPQHRLAMEVVWETLENAGYSPDQWRRKKVGVFLGIERKDYADRMRAHGIEIDGHLNTGNAHAMLVNRIAHFFDWTGPVQAVDAACSSSFVALDEAIRAVRSGRADAALAGGVHLTLSPDVNIYNRKLGLFTGAGVVCPFDQQADGHFFSDGLGAVLIKPLADAERDGDEIYGVIRGMSVRHGGQSLFLTAPNGEIHETVIRDALTEAGLEAYDIDYIEAQGTANPIGDEMELKAFSRVFSHENAPRLGTIKGHVGHFSGASGIISLIKGILSLKTDTLVKTANLHALNWNEENGPFPCQIVTQTASWAPKQRSGKRVPRHISVHNYGFGGIAGHAILSEYLTNSNESAAYTVSEQEHAVILSAPNKEKLVVKAQQLYAFLNNKTSEIFGQATVHIRDIAFTLQTGRKVYEHRLVIFASSLQELQQRLEGYCNKTTDERNVIERTTSAGKDVRALFGSQDMVATLAAWVSNRHIRSLGQVWSLGVAVDWNGLYLQAPKPRRVALPTHPFERRELWFTQVTGQMTRLSGAKEAETLVSSMLHMNTSNFFGQSYLSRFSSTDPCFVEIDNKRGQRFTPICYLQMAVEALEHALDTHDDGLTLSIISASFGPSLDLDPQQQVSLITRLEPNSDQSVDCCIVQQPSNSSPAQEDPLFSACLMATDTLERPVLDKDKLAVNSGQEGMRLHDISDLPFDDAVDAWIAEILMPVLGGVDTPIVSLELGVIYAPISQLKEADFICLDVVASDGRRLLDLDICDREGYVLLRLQGLLIAAGLIGESEETVLKAMPEAFRGMIPTLNGTGAMTTRLPACSDLFVEYAAEMGGEVLDMGCAYGVASIAALERGAEVLAVDIEQQHLSILSDLVAPNMRDRLELLCGKLPDLDLSEHRFTAIHAARVLHFLSPDDFSAAVRKMAAWLKPGGKLFIVCDSPYFPHWAARVGTYEEYKEAGHAWPGYIENVQHYLAERAHAEGFSSTEGDQAENALKGTDLINLIDPDILIRECEAAGLFVEMAGYEGLALDLDGEKPDSGLEHASIVAVKPLS